MRICGRFSLLLAFLLSGCVHSAPAAPPALVSAPVGPAPVKLAAGEQQFAGNLLVALEPQSKGITFSPSSLHECLTLAAMGAAGSTLQEFCSVLRLPTDFAAQLKGRSLPQGVENADALFVDKRFKLSSGYSKTVTESTNAQIREVNFATPGPVLLEINDWIAKRTHDRIKDVLSRLDPTNVLVLVNAIYLKVDWMFPFKNEQTRPAPFFTGAQTLEKPAMHKEREFGYTVGSGWKMVELPYEGGHLAFDCLLPDEREGWREVRQHLTDSALTTAFQGLKPQQIQLQLPKFQQSSSLSLIPVLQSLGLHRAFGVGANFSGISATPGVYISDVEQKCFVKVDEKGTEAAAATVVSVSRALSVSAEKKAIPFIVDHPFFYFVRDLETGTIFFSGLVLEPES